MQKSECSIARNLPSMATRLIGLVLWVLRSSMVEYCETGRRLDLIRAPWRLSNTAGLSFWTWTLDAELRVRPKLCGSVLAVQLFVTLFAFSFVDVDGSCLPRYPSSSALACPPTIKLRRSSRKSGLVSIRSDYIRQHIIIVIDIIVTFIILLAIRHRQQNNLN